MRLASAEALQAVIGAVAAHARACPKQLRSALGRDDRRIRCIIHGSRLEGVCDLALWPLRRALQLTLERHKLRIVPLPFLGQ